MVSALFLLLVFLGVWKREWEQDKDIYKEKWNISLLPEQRLFPLSRCAFFSGLVDAIFPYFPNFLVLQEQGDIIRDTLLYSPLVQRKASTVELQGLRLHLPFLILHLWDKLFHFLVAMLSQGHREHAVQEKQIGHSNNGQQESK